jgi:chromosomal replication initiation ATPase DnaA
MFSENKSRARLKYREFMSGRDTLNKATVYATVDQRLQGDAAFVERVMEQHDKEAVQTRKKKKGLDEIAQTVETLYETTLDEIRSNYRTVNIARARKIFSQVAIALGHRRSEIAKFMQKDPAAVTQHLMDKEQARADVRLVLRALDGNNSST